ncbi:probable RNA-directed DNA polymerase from transposon BS [Caerostris extrusa]|uniref:Probable RNA-directed DNA polymerase from transposon BS n=1 Tax=Caerostris extrusa TaxID=172846 RepID=A0AAV4WU53_CAEEX|nr:probable RNA-directed DNA polymerase from transposon BS [Caerostris extrusa]
MGSYRPIALTCMTCKLMERIILRRITFPLMNRNMLPQEQYGFRMGHSTIDQILYFVQRVRDAHNMKPSRHNMAVFLDLTKAFDKVWKNKVLGKCFSEFDIKGRALPWLSDFMKNRSFRVRYQNSLSEIFKTYQGIPQGSVLSPTLFSLYLTGIERVISPCQIGIFAAYIIVWDHNLDLTKLENTLNGTLEKIQHFADEHKLAFNTTKSLNCLFTTNRHFVARIITGLRHSCPNGIACYEADLQPLSWRREINMANNVTFNEDLKGEIKHEEHPELLRQLALVIINNISPWALVIYIDGSKSDTGRTGSEIFMNTSTGEFRYRFRNPDHSSVIRSELAAISEALSLAFRL